MGHAQSHQPSRGGLRTTNEAIQPHGYFCSDGELGACVTSGPRCVRCICLHAPYRSSVSAVCGAEALPCPVFHLHLLRTLTKFPNSWTRSPARRMRQPPIASRFLKRDSRHPQRNSCRLGDRSTGDASSRGKDIDGDDFIRLVASVPKCSVVGNSQVAPKPVDDSSHCDETGAVILKIELTDDFAILPVFDQWLICIFSCVFSRRSVRPVVATHGLGQLLCLPLQRSIRIVRRERLGYVTD
jgi:hypothetical protein